MQENDFLQLTAELFLGGFWNRCLQEKFSKLRNLIYLEILS